MFDYLDKFNNLSDDIKMAVDSDEAVKIIEEIEKKYKVELASIVMRVASKDLALDSLPLVFFTELNLGQDQSEKLSEELKERVFYKIAKHLGMEEKQKKAKDESLDRDLDVLINDFNSLPSENHKETISDNGQKNSYAKKTKDQVDKIISILNFKFSPEEKDRFSVLLEKYLRGVKNKIELRGVFVKTKEMGGFGLADQMVDNIFMIASELQNEEYEEVKDKTKVDKDVLNKINRLSHGFLSEKSSSKMLPEADSSHLLAPFVPLAIDKPENKILISPARELVAKLENKSQEVDQKTENKKNETIEKRPLNNELIDKMNSEFSKVEKQILEEIEREIKKEENILLKDKEKKEKDKEKELQKKESFEIRPKVEEIPFSQNSYNPISRQQVDGVSAEGGKIKMMDVKKIKIMGPIDELRYLDLVNFRRLSKNPKEALEKIREKIKVLEELDYGKMIEGIKAWRQSYVHKLYLKIFLDAGNRGLGVNQIIAELKSYGKDYLEKEELDAIVEFNKTLRF